ncbi:hypothetical protein I2483_02880 [Sporosarcina sp. E16_3]|uniref:DUF5696 domain-containing protein n=1 Tax=Sporosarcina sp. E16_3 TaxID=2789293 RepID=UPI001A91E647|nr:DUF5696 domain-containing protein [Sporosarcina sp. E16_3]MBO0600597.1 hypothetical protein [Sporosarcina sp. E16_3]
MKFWKKFLANLTILTLLLSFITTTSFAENNDKKGVVVKNNSKTLVFPDAEDFQKIAENDGFILRADPKTGHFTVENKKIGDVLKSFPNPDKWDEEKTAASWQSHLKSPFMFSYVETKERKDQVKESNYFSSKSNITFEKIENGYRVTYEIPDLGFVIPIEVRLEEDFVETIVLADDIQENVNAKKDNGAHLVSLRLFPFLGADNSDDEEGFLFLPDGSGVLVDFKKNRASTNSLYSERIYGFDQAFATKASLSSRLPIKMPVFGIKANNQAILGVVHEGDTYTNIVSAPSESYSQYNWVTGEHLFRFKVFQPTNKQKTDGFYIYSKDMQRTKRAIRYYMIDEADYVNMAGRYRQYLMEEQGLKRKESDDKNLELSLHILGGGMKSGFIWDSYLPLTTTEQAIDIVKDLGSLGVNDMSITYHGWEKSGYGKYGSHFPIAKKLGGNDEMKEFTDFAREKGHSVYLDASTYTYNSTGANGFRANRDGLRDLGSNVMEFKKRDNNTVLVSPRFMQGIIFKELEKAKELGVQGYLFGEGIGSSLPSDYNENHIAERHEVKEIQKDIIKKTKEEFGDVRITSGNFYTLQDSSHIEQMHNDYSYDLFVDRTIPFAQIALHGLVSYSFNYGNMSGNVKESLLKGIEYGATPSFLVTYEESHRLLESRSMYRFYSTYYKDWEAEIASQYQLFNEALADVQDQFIVDHREITKGVFETKYENKKRIIVNYNEHSYTYDGNKVGAEGFIILEGGD